MENRGFVILALGFFAFVPQLVSAYAVSTHAELSAAVIQEYEARHGDVFTGVEEQALVQGSKDEDDSLRFLNHFFDGVTGAGLTANLAASVWATDIIEQANWGLGKIGINGLPSHKPLFSGNQDHTWQRAVYEYVHGDKQRAAKSLGHILHLVQDVTVPAHARGDMHPYKWGLGDKDDYEDFTRSMNVTDVVLPSEVRAFGNIEQAIRETAQFTQENFLSSDTIFEKYSLPSRSNILLQKSLDDGNGQFFGNTNNGKIVRIRQWRDKEVQGAPQKEEYFLTDKKNKILTENWEVLSARAVSSGVGVLELFFKEVEKERATGKLLAMNKSYKDTERTMKALALQRDSTASLTSLAAADVYELNKDDLDGYFAAAEVYGIHVPSIVRESPLKDDQPATALLGFEEAFQTIIGEELPEGTPPHEQQGTNEQEEDDLNAQLDEANELVTELLELVEEREQECIEESIRGPWDMYWWNGDKPGCDDPTPKIQKMYWTPIQGVGGQGGSGGGAISGSISADPESGFFGWTDISWTSSGASSCEVTGTNGSMWTGTSGTESVLLSADATFTLNCDGSDIASVLADVDIPFEM